MIAQTNTSPTYYAMIWVVSSASIPLKLHPFDISYAIHRQKNTSNTNQKKKNIVCVYIYLRYVIYVCILLSSECMTEIITQSCVYSLVWNYHAIKPGAARALRFSFFPTLDASNARRRNSSSKNITSQTDCVDTRQTGRSGRKKEKSQTSCWVYSVQESSIYKYKYIRAADRLMAFVVNVDDLSELYMYFFFRFSSSPSFSHATLRLDDCLDGLAAAKQTSPFPSLLLFLLLP